MDLEWERENPRDVVLTIFFSIRPEGFLRRGEDAVTQAEVEAAGAAVSFTGKKAGADIPRITGAEDFMARYPFERCCAAMIPRCTMVPLPPSPLRR